LAQSRVTKARNPSKSQIFRAFLMDLATEAEREGYSTRHFRNPLRSVGLRLNSRLGISLRSSGRTPLFPVVPGCGGAQPGQIRDKSISRDGTESPTISIGFLAGKTQQLPTDFLLHASADQDLGPMSSRLNADFEMPILAVNTTQVVTTIDPLAGSVCHRRVI